MFERVHGMNLKESVLNNLLLWLCIGGISIWGGIVKHIIDNRSRKMKNNSRRILNQVIISCFTGMLGGLCVYETGGSESMMFLAAGISSATGNNILIYIRKRFFP